MFKRLSNGQNLIWNLGACNRFSSKLKNIFIELVISHLEDLGTSNHISYLNQRISFSCFISCKRSRRSILLKNDCRLSHNDQVLRNFFHFPRFRNNLTELFLPSHCSYLGFQLWARILIYKSLVWETITIRNIFWFRDHPAIISSEVGSNSLKSRQVSDVKPFLSAIAHFVLAPHFLQAGTPKGQLISSLVSILYLQLYDLQTVR